MMTTTGDFDASFNKSLNKFRTTEFRNGCARKPSVTCRNSIGKHKRRDGVYWQSRVVAHTTRSFWIAGESNFLVYKENKFNGRVEKLH